jgi:inhibitor of cysteine peptidase
MDDMTTLSSYAILAVVAQSAMSDVVLTEADAGSTRQVKRGETVELRLKENPSTGYRWTIDVEPPGGATIAASSQEPGGPGLGANGVHVFKDRRQRLGRRHPQRQAVALMGRRGLGGGAEVVHP